MDRWVSVIAAITAMGCASPAAENVGLAVDAIAGGDLTTGDEAVVGMVAQDELYCTGTLVAQHIVLTAGHCLPPNLPVDPSAVKVFAGPSWAEGGRIIDNTDVWVHPDFLAGGVWSDIGLVALVDGAGPPIALRTFDPTDGEDMRIVGYGRTDADETGDDKKRTGAATVASVLQDGMILQAAPASACAGDSGGPALAMEAGVERIAGINSRGNCEFESTYMRANQFLTEVQTFIDAHPPPTCDADDRCAFACTNPDPDCPEPEPEEEEPVEEGGCAVAPPTPGNADLWPLAALLALGVLRRRHDVA